MYLTYNKDHMKLITFLAFMVLTITSFAQNTGFNNFGSDQFETIITGREIKEIEVANPLYDSIYYWTYSAGTSDWTISGKDDDFIYNGENLLSMTHYQFDGTWLPAGMEVFTYDGHGNKLSHLLKQYSSGGWENVSIRTYTYNSNNNNTSRIDQVWSNGNWQNDYKLINTYDEMGNNLSVLSYTSDSTNVWFNNKRTVITYNENNDRLSSFAQMWYNNVWNNWYDYSYNYDDLARVSMIHSKRWYQNDWNLQEKHHYQYTNNNLDTILSEELKNGLWKNYRITSQWYNENDMQIRSLTRYFFFDEWMNDTQYSIGYDSRGNVALIVTERWNFQEWKPVSRVCNEFNENNIRTGYSYTDYQWEEIRGDSTHYFLHETLGTYDIQSPEISVYPNPTNGLLAISGANQFTAVELYNLTGKRITILKFEHGTADLSGLPSGIYILKIIMGDKVVMRKVVKS